MSATNHLAFGSIDKITECLYDIESVAGLLQQAKNEHLGDSEDAAVHGGATIILRAAKRIREVIGQG